jgi:hypothetical protein
MVNYRQNLKNKKYGGYNMKKAISALIVSCFLIVFIGSNVFATTIEFNSNLNKLTDTIMENSLKNPNMAMSSNPYDYINNQYFDKIVDMGVEALPIIKKEIQKSKANGLREYILAMAAEEIAKIDLKEGHDYKTRWASAKDFVPQWHEYLVCIPANVKQITSSNASKEEKTEKLIKLGKPAIPFIMDEIENGNEEIGIALDELTADTETKTITNTNRNEKKDYKEFVKMNKAKFNNFRDLVNSEKTANE